MTAQKEMYVRRLDAFSGGLLIASITVAVVGGLFFAEGVLGYFYNTSMFLEGLDHFAEIVAGLAVAASGALLAVSAWLNR